MSLVERRVGRTVGSIVITKEGNGEVVRPFPIVFRRVSWSEIRSGAIQTVVLVLSDIHSGAPFSQLDKAAQVAEAVRSRSIVIAGDLCEHDFPEKHLREKDWRNIERIKMAVSKDRPIIVIPGNHDLNPSLTVLREVGALGFTRSPYIVEQSGIRIAIIHGHEGDGLFPKDGEPLRKVSDFAHNLTLKVKHLKTPHDKAGNFVYNLRGKVQKYAAEVAKAHNAQIILHGHVHEVRRTDLGGVRVVNIGDFIHKNVSFAAIDDNGLVVYTVY